MNLLRTERDTLNSYLPGLDKYLSEIPLLELEKPGNGALQKFRELGGPALLVPAEYEGKGATLLDAVRIQRAVGSRSPSLAVATTMHHFSVASLVELTAAGNGFEWAMLMAIAENSWLLSSGFAEGKPGQHILTPTMRAVRADGGITVSGVKKPCSLTWSMNLMSASVAVADPATGTDRLAVVLIPADSAGIERAPFWQTTALAAAESDQVTLTEVFVPEALIFYPQDGESMDPIQARGFVWFELLVSACYLGAATNLAERAIARGRGSDEDRAGLAIELETMVAALEQVACVAATAGDNDALLAQALYVRFATERAIERVTMSAAAALGGMSFIESPEIAYLLGATRALAFHPPSRAAAASPLARYLADGQLTLLFDYRPSDWRDYDLEGGLRAWPPSAAERRAIDAAYDAAAAAARAESAARDAYEYARLGWLLEHAGELAECEPAHECVVELPGDDQWIEFEELDPGGTVCGARCQGAGTYGFGSAAEALGAASGLTADDRWVAAVCAALTRERTWTRRGRRSMLVVKEASGEMFHATATENRQSILRHGLDWRQMGTVPGIAGSRAPELPAVFLCESREETGFFTRMSRLPADIWAVRVDGLWVESGPHGWIILPEPVPPERLRLLQG